MTPLTRKITLRMSTAMMIAEMMVTHQHPTKSMVIHKYMWVTSTHQNGQPQQNLIMVRIFLIEVDLALIGII